MSKRARLMSITAVASATATLALVAAQGALPALAADPDVVNPPPTAQDWTALAKLPDWSGVWTPVISDQEAQEKGNTPPWKPQVAKQMAHLAAEEDAGRPFPIIDHCFPTGMPSWMLITHNAFEVLFTPGRVTILGEGDGNRLRRIYTDGRAHPADPDPSFHGHSIGRWEGDTLVIDTVGVLPKAYLAISEAVGIPNNGDMHIVERMHLQGPDTLDDDLVITANKVLTKPWSTTRKYYRQRARKFDIMEGVCEQGSFTEAVDKNGNSTFAPIKFHNGVPVGTK
jgi:hypothetical protein